MTAGRDFHDGADPCDANRRNEPGRARGTLSIPDVDWRNVAGMFNQTLAPRGVIRKRTSHFRRLKKPEIDEYHRDTE